MFTILGFLGTMLIGYLLKSPFQSKLPDNVVEILAKASPDDISKVLETASNCFVSATERKSTAAIVIKKIAGNSNVTITDKQAEKAVDWLIARFKKPSKK